MRRPAPAARLPFGHLTVILRNDADGGRTYGIYANFERDGLRGRPLFSGVIERSTATELRRIAGEMDSIMDGGS